jgi:hypothetical protein
MRDRMGAGLCHLIILCQSSRTTAEMRLAGELTLDIANRQSVRPSPPSFFGYTFCRGNAKKVFVFSGRLHILSRSVPRLGGNMKSVGDIVKKVTTEHGAYIAIAVVGFVSAVAGLFMNVNGTMSIKWLIGVVWLSLTIILILARALTASMDRHILGEEIRVIKYFPAKGVLLVRSNFDLPVNAVLSIFVTNEGYEELYALGLVENVQGRQVASVRITRIFIAIPEDTDLEIAAVIKTTLPYRVFEDHGL